MALWPLATNKGQYNEERLVKMGRFEWFFSDTCISNTGWGSKS